MTLLPVICGVMDAAERSELYTRVSEQSRRDQKSPGNRDGVSQHQAVLEWGTYEKVLYELEHAGKLVAIRVGNKVWYSRAQLVALLGEPGTSPIPPALKRRDNGGRATGGQYSQGELALTSRAA
jgi:hypothetical protein